MEGNERMESTTLQAAYDAGRSEIEALLARMHPTPTAACVVSRADTLMRPYDRLLGGPGSTGASS